MSDIDESVYGSEVSDQEEEADEREIIPTNIMRRGGVPLSSSSSSAAAAASVSAPTSVRRTAVSVSRKENDDDGDDDDVDDDNDDDADNDDDDDDDKNPFSDDEAPVTEKRHKPKRAINDDDDDDELPALAGDDDQSETSGEEGFLEEDLAETDSQNDAMWDSDEEPDHPDANYLQKFSEDMRKNVIAKYHPELNMHTESEIAAMCVVLRNAAGAIDDINHRTVPILSRYERARVLGERAKQLDSGATPFVTVEKDVIDGYCLALSELDARKLPFIIKRPLPNGTCEYWRINDLEVL